MRSYHQRLEGEPVIVHENALKKIWSEGGAAINGWLGLPSSFSAEIMAHAGWNSLTIDMQHGLIDYQTAVHMLQGLSSTDVTPLVRVPWNDPGIIMKMLDAGALGVICPMINSRAEAERLVQACRYAPRGQRSFGPVRAAVHYGADYSKNADDAVVVFAMIETKMALDALDEILGTPELDAIYIGPSDLSGSLTGKFGFDHAEGTVQFEAIEHILAAAKRHNIVPGIHTASPQYAAKMIALGFQFVTVASDTKLLEAGARAAVDAMRGSRGEIPAAANTSSAY